MRELLFRASKFAAGRSLLIILAACLTSSAAGAVDAYAQQCASIPGLGYYSSCIFVNTWNFDQDECGYFCCDGYNCGAGNNCGEVCEFITCTSDDCARCVAPSGTAQGSAD